MFLDFTFLKMKKLLLHSLYYCDFVLLWLYSCCILHYILALFNTLRVQMLIQEYQTQAPPKADSCAV